MKKKFRLEFDSLGTKKIDSAKLWGAQTQRSLENFRIGNEKMPKEIIIFKPSSTDILRGCVSFSGSIKRNPVVGLGEVGTKIFSIFSPPEIPSGVLQQTIPKVFKGSLG